MLVKMPRWKFPHNWHYQENTSCQKPARQKTRASVIHGARYTILCHTTIGMQKRVRIKHPILKENVYHSHSHRKHLYTDFAFSVQDWQQTGNRMHTNATHTSTQAQVVHSIAWSATRKTSTYTDDPNFGSIDPVKNPDYPEQTIRFFFPSFPILQVPPNNI